VENGFQPCLWLWLISLGLAVCLPIASAGAAALVRGPYLQMGTPTSIIIRWRTDVLSDGRVRFGTESTNLTSTVDEAASVTNHLVTLTNLVPDTVYFYSIGSATETLAGGTNYFFRTAPPAGSQRPIRIWVLGDSGMTNMSAGPVRDAYYNFTGSRYTDLWLMLGDNAYHGGSDNVWQVGVFNTYPTLLRQTVLWSCIGNQETFNLPNAPPTLPYFDNLSLPMSGEAGGVPSGTEKYYSFDYGNIHFICLDSMSSVRTMGSSMLTWLEADLAAFTNDWLIAFWHHPPYSKGSNDSDTKTEQIEMRANAVVLLEAHGVDLVLGGHSHSYERSYLIDGHYGLSSTLTTNMLKNPGSGRPDQSGAYSKNTLGAAPYEGTVYAVAGSGCSLGGGTLNHPAMFFSTNRLGSMVLDIHANRLDAKFIRETGATNDSFTLIKGAPQLRVTSLVLSGQNLTLGWISVADRAYRVESSVSLTSPRWDDLSGPLVAPGAKMSWTGTNASPAVQAFYRVLQLGN
jgi:hypothetical protein